MKTLWIISLGVAGLVHSARAQLFTPEGLTGATIGGVAGGVIGHNNGRHTAEGIAIGAGAGLLLGNASHYARREREYAELNQPYYAVPDPSYANAGYYPPPGGYAAPVVVYEERPSYALSGALLGGLMGAIIGDHNHYGLEGAAIGAGSGLLLGSLADRAVYNRSRRPSRPWDYSAYTLLPPGPAVTPAAVPARPEEKTPPPPRPMSRVNALFGR